MRCARLPRAFTATIPGATVRADNLQTWEWLVVASIRFLLVVSNA